MGARLAHLVAGAWRPDAAPWEGDLDEPLHRALVAGGVLGLAAHRLDGRDGPLADGARAAHLSQALAGDLQTVLLRELLTALHRDHIDPILLKGLAVARYYPVDGGRPMGDMDLLVPSDVVDVAAARAADLGYTAQNRIRSRIGLSIVGRGQEGTVDLRTHLWPLSPTEAALALHAHQRVCNHGLDVRTLPRELEVRYLAVHGAKHGFARAIWLCDLAAALEYGSEVDWDRLLAGSSQIRSWILAAAGLASRLLGLQLPGEVERRAAPIAAWIEPQVLARWGGAVAFDTTYVTISALKRHDLPRAIHSLAPARVGSLEALTTLSWPLSPALAGPAVAGLMTRRAILLLRRLVREILSSHL